MNSNHTDDIQINSRLYLIVDNRLFPSNDISTEAYLTSYYRGIQPLIAEFGNFLCRERWNSFPITVAYASSAQTVQLSQINHENVHALYNMLETRHSSFGGATAANITWQSYFTDALRKLTHYTVTRLNYQQTQEVEKILIIIYSTEIAIFGDTNAIGGGSIQEGLNSFKLSCEQIFGLRDLIEMRIVCFGLFENQLSMKAYPRSSSSFSLFPENGNNSNPFLFHTSILQHFSTKIQFERRLCSVSNFDEEYKLLTGLASPKKIVRLDLPSYQSTECSLMIALSTSYIASIRAMQMISSFKVCGMSLRDGINPMYLCGDSLFVDRPHDKIALKALQANER